MFCAVRCPRCGRHQASHFPIKVSICRTCGRRIDLEKYPPVRTFERERDLRWFLSELKLSNTSVRDSRPIPTGPSDRKAGPMSNREQRMEVILSTIGDGQTSIDGIKAACFEKGIDGPEFDLLLETLRSRNLVYSPKLGKVARVERTD